MYKNETFISVFFGNFDLIGDILDVTYINWTSTATWHVLTIFKASFVMVKCDIFLSCKI